MKCRSVRIISNAIFLSQTLAFFDAKDRGPFESSRSSWRDLIKLNPNSFFRQDPPVIIRTSSASESWTDSDIPIESHASDNPSDTSRMTANTPFPRYTGVRDSFVLPASREDREKHEIPPPSRRDVRKQRSTRHSRSHSRNRESERDFPRTTRGKYPDDAISLPYRTDDEDDGDFELIDLDSEFEDVVVTEVKREEEDRIPADGYVHVTIRTHRGERASFSKTDSLYDCDCINTAMGRYDSSRKLNSTGRQRGGRCDDIVEKEPFPRERSSERRGARSKELDPSAKLYRSDRRNIPDIRPYRS